MFTLWGARQRFCDGMNRRNFLKIGAFGAGLTLADMLRITPVPEAYTLAARVWTMLGNRQQADAVRAEATAIAGGSASSFSSIGSTFKNLRVSGVAMNDVSPNTRVDLPAAQFGPGSYALLYERSGATSTPAPGQIPSTNTVTVRVTDNGIPPLSDSETITIVVIAPPQFTQTALNGGQLALTWQTTPGHSYRIEFKADLNDSSWTPLSNDMTAGGRTLSVNLDITSAPAGFYRVLLVN